MTAFRFVLSFFVINQCFDSLLGGNYKNHIAFFCGRPSMVFLNGSWVADYNQRCIKNELGIVSYCQRKFFDKIISSAEPAMEKYKFTKWCDFDGKNCEVDVEIRPFKCLESKAKSDALIVHNKCFLGYLEGDGHCKHYKEWVFDARRNCSKKANGIVRSSGMLIPCLESRNPVFFKAVEFECCPKSIQSKTSEEIIANENKFHPYMVNGTLETEEEEDRTYGIALNRLKQFKKEWKESIITDYKNAEKNLKKSWRIDPRKSKNEEHNLISKFKTEINAVDYELSYKEENLLSLHDERLRLIFSTKLNVAMRNLDAMLRKPVKREVGIRDAMVKVLELLVLRKRQILNERLLDKSLHSNLIASLSDELKIIQRNISATFAKLKLVPQFKVAIKQYLIMYLTKTSPRISNEKVDNPEEQSGRNSEINKIIAFYRVQKDYAEDDDVPNVNNSLGLHDRVQAGHHGNVRHSLISNKKVAWNPFTGQKLPIILLFASVAVVVILISVVTLLFIMHRRALLKRRGNTRKYKKFQNEPSFQDGNARSPKMNIIYNHSVFSNTQPKMTNTNLEPLIDDNSPSPLIT